MFFRGKLILLYGLVIALFVIGCTNQKQAAATKPPGPDVMSSLQQLEKAADDLYQKTTDGSYEAALLKAQEINNMLTTIRFQGVTTAEGVKALTDTALEAKKTLTAVKLSPDAALLAAAKLRLAVDSLTHKNEPMWHQYYEVLKEDLQELEAAGQAQNPKDMQQAFAEFEQHYNMIRPSIILSRGPTQAEKGDSFVTFMKTEMKADQLQYGRIVTGVKQFSEHVNDLFGMSRSEQSAYVPMTDKEKPVVWTIMLGLFIVAVLSFSAWRMYPGESGAGGGNRHIDGR